MRTGGGSRMRPGFQARTGDVPELDRGFQGGIGGGSRTGPRVPWWDWGQFQDWTGGSRVVIRD